ncbi:hypothetical protein ACFSSF_19290 [Dietzia aerolata]|uniref:hypothetical protein n=1 Tax=Dietzia aerolata TaxID=595984 RepID=UPI00363C6159
MCEHSLDPGAEDAHMHSAGDQNAPTPTQVLTTVLGRDTRNTSAIDTLRQEYTTATAPERLEQLYRHGADLAAQTFTANTLPDYLDALPAPTPTTSRPTPQPWPTSNTPGPKQPKQAWTPANCGSRPPTSSTPRNPQAPSSHTGYVT